MKRKFTIPIKFNGNINEKRKFHTQIKKLGLTIQYGGKISNLGDKVDKSKDDKYSANYKLKLIGDEKLPKYLIDNKNKYLKWFDHND